jgi:ATP-dependent exoDNAse (exonuclease V) beta subunit
VLASHALAAGLDPGFRVLNEPESARLSGLAFDAAFEQFAARGGGDRFEMAAAFRLDDLRGIVRAAHDELRSRGHERPELPAVDPPDVAAAVSELRAAAEAALERCRSTKTSRAVEDRIDRIAAVLVATEPGSTPPSDDEVESWRFKIPKALAGPEVERYLEARRAVERCLVEDRFAHHYEHLRELVGLYGREYGRLKDGRSALDFEDLQLRAAALLRERPQVRRRYQRAFRHVMVDEFQDTNALQLSIVRLLHVEDGLEQNRLFTVGDELQSIYSFRHADVEVFRSERATMDAAPDERAGVRRLTGSFRSRPEVLALVNRIGASLFGGAYEELAAGTAPATGAGAVEVLVTEREGWDDEAVDPGVSRDERAQSWRVAEARFLAERLAALHEEGVPRGDMVVLLRSYSYVEAYEEALEDAGLAPHVIGGRGYWSRQQVTDVRNLLASVVNPLDDRALLGVLASPACAVSADALWLLKRAAGGAAVWSAVAWLYGSEAGDGDGDVERAGWDEERAGDDGAAGRDGGGRDVEDADPAETARDDARAAWRERATECARHMPEEDAAAVRELTVTLTALRAEAPRLSLEALIDRAITATGYDLALLMRSRGRRRLANVRKLMRLAREFEADAGRDLRGFLDFATSEAEASDREAEAAVDAEGHDGVRVMTVHAAKGLEFPVVAVADLGRGLAAGIPPALRVEPAEPPEGGLPALRVGLRLARLGRSRLPIFEYAELQAAAVEREREEERRILHVAMTRAEDRLLLSGVLKLDRLGEEPRDADPLIAPVLRALAWDGAAETVELDPPRLREGLDGAPTPVSVPVLTRRPGDVAAEHAAASVDPAGEPLAGVPPEPPADVAPPTLFDPAEGVIGRRPAAASLGPLPDPKLAPLDAASAPPVRAISYSALALYERCGYRFYAERVLGMRRRLPAGSPVARPAGRDEEAVGADDALDERHLGTDDDGVLTRYARGRVVHELLERSARERWSPPDVALVAALLEREGVSAEPAHVARAVALVEAFLASSLRSELAAAVEVHPEAPFAFRAGGLLVRGEIDLLADLDEEVAVVDYKSDALRGDSPADHMGRYEVQRDIYALAALRRYGRPVRVVYVFLERPDEPIERRFAPAEAGPLGERVAAMAGAIVAGDFEVTATPERPLCLDCPARERLCSHPPELTLRDAA